MLWRFHGLLPVLKINEEGSKMNDQNSRELSKGKKTLLEFLPLVAFFAAYKFKGLIWATGVLVVASLIAIAVQYAVTRKISKMQIVTTGMIVVFGGLTLYLQDPFYLKIKISIINGLLGLALAVGLFMNKLFLRDMLGTSIQMPDAAWRNLSWRWVLFFFALAILNIVIWQNFSENVWVNFKFYGMTGLTLLFAVANAPFMAKHMPREPQNPSADG